MNTEYLRTDEWQEAVSALESVAEFAEKVSIDPYRWKWVIIAVHNAVQGFMVLALRRGSGLMALKDKVAQKWLEAYERGETYPEEKLDTFLNLYTKIKSPKMCCYGHSKHFLPTVNNDRSMKRLNEFRNEFIHFVPKGWSLQLEGLPDICLNCLSVLSFLAWESGNIMWNESEMRSRAEAAYKSSVESLTQVHLAYTGSQQCAGAVKPHSA